MREQDEESDLRPPAAKKHKNLTFLTRAPSYGISSYAPQKKKVQGGLGRPPRELRARSVLGGPRFLRIEGSLCDDCSYIRARHLIDAASARLASQAVDAGEKLHSLQRVAGLQMPATRT